MFFTLGYTAKVQAFATRGLFKEKVERADT